MAFKSWHQILRSAGTHPTKLHFNAIVFMLFFFFFQKYDFISRNANYEFILQTYLFCVIDAIVTVMPLSFRTEVWANSADQDQTAPGGEV